MAVNRGGRPVLNGLRPVKGSIRLIALRWGVVVLASLPTMLVALMGVAEGPARQPYYTDIDERTPAVHLLRLAKDLPPGLLPALVISIGLAILADQLLTGGALAILRPERPAGDRVNVTRAVLDDGLVHLWAFLRAALVGLVLSATGVALLRFVVKKIAMAGERAGWSGATIGLTLPLIQVFVALVWLSTVGAWVFWCRLITAADGRRRVRRTGLLVLGVWRRYPLRSWGLFVALTLASTLISGAVLVAWRQAEPSTGGAVAVWAVVWALTLGVQAFVWLWLLRSGRLLYESGDLTGLRGRPDEGLGIVAKLAFWRRRSRAAPAPALAPAPATEASP